MGSVTGVTSDDQLFTEIFRDEKNWSTALKSVDETLCYFGRVVEFRFIANIRFYNTNNFNLNVAFAIKYNMDKDDYKFLCTLTLFEVAALFDNDIYPQIDKLINKEKFMEEYKFLVHTQKYLLQPPETRLMRYKEYKINPNKTLPKPIKKEFKELIIKPVIYNKPIAPIKLPKQEVIVSYDYNYSEPTIKEYKNVLYYCNKALTGFNLLGFVGKLLKRNQ